LFRSTRVASKERVREGSSSATIENERHQKFSFDTVEEMEGYFENIIAIGKGSKQRLFFIRTSKGIFGTTNVISSVFAIDLSGMK
jgi:hypothetical protein